MNPHPLYRSPRRPKAVLFDLFHTLVSVRPPAATGDLPISEILGVRSDEWQRLYYDEDTFGRCVGRVRDSAAAMRAVAHAIDPTVSEDRIQAAVASRRRQFESGLLSIEVAILNALDAIRAAGVLTAIVSDAGADDIESWPQSPLHTRFDATIFSYEVGCRKPDARIYRTALRALKVEAADVVFVGDGGSDEHMGARALGIETVLVTRLIAPRFAHTIPERRSFADWMFDDVPAFAEAFGLATGADPASAQGFAGGPIHSLRRGL